MTRLALPSALRRAMRLELSHPQPPTPTTGTTYIIEMYQCIRQASGTISRKSITPSPRLSWCPSAPTGGGAATAVRGRVCTPAAYEQHEQESRHDDRRAKDDRRQRCLGVLGRPKQLPVDRALGVPDFDRNLPVEDQRPRALVLDVRGRHRRHPVDAVVVPFELAGAVYHFPLRRSARAGDRRDRDLCVEVRVQIRRRRAYVLLGRAVGEHARIRFAFVAVDRDGLAGVVAQ